MLKNSTKVSSQPFSTEVTFLPKPRGLMKIRVSSLRHLTLV